MIDRHEGQRIRYEPPGFFDRLSEMAVELTFCVCLGIIAPPLIIALEFLFLHGPLVLPVVA